MQTIHERRPSSPRGYVRPVAISRRAGAGLIALGALALGVTLAACSGAAPAGDRGIVSTERAMAGSRGVGGTDLTRAEDQAGNGPTTSVDRSVPTSDPGADPLASSDGDARPAPLPPTPAPTNRPPTISDIEVDASGLTVVVRYRVSDPDGDAVSTDTTFGVPVRTGLEPRSQAPQQAPITNASGSASGSGGGATRVPTAPGGVVLLDEDEPTDPGAENHGPQPTGDGALEARYTYDRAEVGSTPTALITIVARDEHGAETSESARFELMAIDLISLSNVTYRVPDEACFESVAARRLFGNVDLQGAMRSRNALSEELRVDRPQITLLRARTVEAPAGQGLTVSFQPAMEGQTLTNHVVTHIGSASVSAPIGSGTCAGVLSYRVEIATR
jgi:hypothetical protein